MRLSMWKQIQVGDTLVEFDAEATANYYAGVSGTTETCDCGYCENYRQVWSRVYPAEFLALLALLGIDYCKETELTHLSDDEGSDRTYGHSVDGHFAFVGRVVSAGEGTYSTTKSFDCRVDSNAHPTTKATFGNEAPMIDLQFFVQEVPLAEAR